MLNNNMASGTRKSKPAEEWVMVKDLGSGGFGVVTLWKNKKTGQELALKKIKYTRELTEKHRERWSAEINILQKMNHDNVIKSVPVPTQLASYGDDGCQPMAMEYCEGGSLRQVLVQLENCCGLREKQVREIASDIGRALEYLHSSKLKVIHRDIKPDNIVLKGGGQRMIYKLIDLGYAKEVSSDQSMCNSFVGTMQYLAPEFLEKKRYTSTVDFWSFGVSMFECITNYRPFLHNIPPLQWHLELCKKADTHICAKRDLKANIKLMETIPIPHFLCRTTQQQFEEWLRLMLRWDGKYRGGAITRVEGQQRYECFIKLEQLLCSHVLHLFCINTDQYLTYPATTNLKMCDLMPSIAHETKVAVADQHFIMSNGLELNPNMLVEHCCQENLHEEDMLVFLLRKNQPQLKNPYTLPPVLDRVKHFIMGQQNIMMDPSEQTSIWSYCCWVCAQGSLEYKRLFQGQRAISLSVYNLDKKFRKEKDKLMEILVRLEGRQELFKTSLQLDLQMAKLLGVEKEAERIWQENLNEVEKIPWKKEFDLVIRPHDVLSHKIVELQSSPFARLKNSDAMGESRKKATELLNRLKKQIKEQKPGDGRSQLSPEAMWDHMKRFMSERKTNLENLYMHLSNITKCHIELKELMNKVHPLEQKIMETYHRIETLQMERQRSIWKQLKNLQEGSSTSIDQARKHDRDSLIVMNENEESRNKLHSLINDSEIQPTSLVATVDWNFLDTAHQSLYRH